MRYFKILENDTTLDLCPDLIGDTFLEMQHEGAMIKLNTCDGELYFKPDEVEEVLI